ncbi:Fic family protein [Corallococcus sp. EGB]|uniref:Fic family protein n=1 Tax=Corallococcus sp. EGB TaxID=1521117 RepID=UPI001CBFE8B5|nr:Fic family protein [Corallococcus sp. EGB]
MKGPPPTEQLAPHREATRALDWALPALRWDLEAAARQAFRETGAQEDFLLRHDAPAHEAQGPARTERFERALARVRRLADAGEPLTFTGMVEVQSMLLGGPTGFRTGDAFARSGAHRYAHTPGLEAAFREKVESEAREQRHPVAHATRLYLDLCFFHPFPDGNARAARLWLEYMLRRGRLPTPPLVPVVLWRKNPGDAVNYTRLARLLARSIAGPDAPCRNEVPG